MPNETNHNLTPEQIKEINDAMAASNPNDSTAIDSERRRLLLDGYRNELLAIIQGIDKSDFAEILDNSMTSERILTFLERSDALSRIDYESQLNHLEGFLTDHRAIQARRVEITRKMEREGAASLSDDEKRTLEEKTKVESLLTNATKAYFETERAACISLIQRETRSYERKVVYQSAKYPATPDALKKGIDQVLNDVGSNTVWNNRTRSWETNRFFRFSERDLPKFVYDKNALDEYVKSYDEYVRANLKQVAREVRIRELGSDMNSRGETFLRMGGSATNKALSIEEFTAEHDRLEKEYHDAIEKYEAFVAETEADPEYKSNLKSPEYQRVLNLENFDRKYEGKSLDQIPDHEKPLYVANKYATVTQTELFRVSDEERELFDKGVRIQALPHLLEMEKNLGQVESTMQKVWESGRDAGECEVQKRELEENKRILAAYKKYAVSGSREDRRSFFNEFNRAYDQAKQSYRDTPDMRERFELRAEQLRRGDFSFVPMANKTLAKKLGMTANWDAFTHTESEMEDLKKLPRTVAEKQYERAFGVCTEPVRRFTLMSEIHFDAMKRPEYTLKQMGQRLEGAALEDYKATIHNDKMEAFNASVDRLNDEIKGYKDAQAALKKRFGFVQRIFGRTYKNQKAFLDRNIGLCRKSYELMLNKTKYDILKTYQEKGLALTKAEAKELNTIVKDATATGRIKDWDEERAQDKARLDEMNAKWLPQEEKPQAVKTQLDLGAQIHKVKTVEEPQKEAPVQEKEKEVEQRETENVDLEK